MTKTWHRHVTRHITKHEHHETQASWNTHIMKYTIMEHAHHEIHTHETSTSWNKHIMKDSNTSQNTHETDLVTYTAPVHQQESGIVMTRHSLSHPVGQLAWNHITDFINTGREHYLNNKKTPPPMSKTLRMHPTHSQAHLIQINKTLTGSQNPCNTNRHISNSQHYFAHTLPLYKYHQAKRLVFH